MHENSRPTRISLPVSAGMQPAETPTETQSADHAGGLFNIFWVSLLIITQLVAVAFAMDWAIISLLDLPFALVCVLAVITAVAVVYCSWFVIRAAVRSERSLISQT